MKEIREHALAAAHAASEKQAAEIVVLDVRELIGITDFFVIASGASERQVNTIAEEVEHVLRERGIRPRAREGHRDGGWVLLDLVDLVVHVFHEEQREYYGLERLWADAPTIEWEGAAASSG